MLRLSINSFRCSGLVLAIGWLVDDAIVVVEAVRRTWLGRPGSKGSSLKAMEQVGGPVVAIALILAASFRPHGIYSRNHRPGFTKQFAVTICRLRHDFRFQCSIR